MVESQDRNIPALAAVNLALLQQEFAADDLIAGYAVTGELDARDVELLVFVDVDVPVDELFGIVAARHRVGHHVDVTLAAVGLAQGLQTLVKESRVEPLAIFLRELRPQGLGVREHFVAAEGDATQLVAVALFNWHQDIDALACRGPQGEVVEATRVANVGLRLAGLRHEVSAAEISLANAFGIFVELAGVEGAGKQVLKDHGVGYPDRLGVDHGVTQDAVVEVVVALEGDLAHLYGRSFLDLESDSYRRRRDGLIDGADGGELVSMLGEQVLQHSDGAHDASFIELALRDEANLGLLKALIHVGLGDRVEALVFHRGDVRLFSDINDKLNTGWGIDPLDLYLFEVAGVPDGVEVALDAGRIVGITLVRRHAGEHGILGDAPLANDLGLAQALGAKRGLCCGGGDRRERLGRKCGRGQKWGRG